MGAAFAAALLGSACGGADFDRSLPARAGGELWVDLELGSGFSFDKGSLEITSHSKDEVRVVAKVSGWGEYAVDIDVRERDGDARVVGRVDGFLHWAFGGPTVDLRVFVPQDYTVDARIDGGPLLLEDLVGPVAARAEGSEVTLRRSEGDVELTVSGGHVTVEDVEGALTIHSREGGVEVSGVRGDLGVRSEDGSIEIASVKGRVDAATKGGAIKIERVRGHVRARTARGRIELDDIEGDVDVATERGRIEVTGLQGRIQAHSGRGGIDVEFAGDPAGAIETERGSIEVEIPADASFALEAETRRGAVELDEDFALVPAATPDVAAPPTSWRELGEGIAREVRDKVSRRLERGLREGNWGELDWDFDWSWEDRGWKGDDHGWGWDRGWGDRDWGRRRLGDGWRGGGRGERVAGTVNGGGATLVLRTTRGSIHVDER